MTREFLWPPQPRRRSGIPLARPTAGWWVSSAVCGGHFLSSPERLMKNVLVDFYRRLLGGHLKFDHDHNDHHQHHHHPSTRPHFFSPWLL